MIAALLLAVGAGAALQINFLLAQSHQLADGQRTSLLQLSRDSTGSPRDLGRSAGGLRCARSARCAVARAGQRRDAAVDDVAVGDPRRQRDRATHHPRSRRLSEAACRRRRMADVSARAYLQQEQDLMAADVRVRRGPGGDQFRTRGSRRARQPANRRRSTRERAAHSAARADDRRRPRGHLVIGLLVLCPAAAGAPSRPRPPLSTRESTAWSAPTERRTGARRSISAAAADLCTALSRVDSSAALPDMLARAAALARCVGRDRVARHRRANWLPQRRTAMTRASSAGSARFRAMPTTRRPRPGAPARFAPSPAT